MNLRMTKQHTIRTLAASAVIAGSVLLTPTVSSSEYRPGVPVAERDAVQASALAAFARANGLAGLSPASLAPLPRGCRGLSPASAHHCPAEVFEALDTPARDR